MTAGVALIGMLALPAAGTLACCAVPRWKLIAATTITVSAIELGIALWLWAAVLAGGRVTAVDDLFFVDAFSAFHLVVLALVFLLCSLFAAVYFAEGSSGHGFSAAEARRFGALWLGSLGTMALVLVSNNLGIMWVGMEATTLLTAFLIALQPNRLSLEAMWKYLLICSVGIAFAFIGTIFAAAAVQDRGSLGADALLWTRLVSPGVHLDPKLLTFAFVFVLVGYGTKAGLAPIHSWLPDAHSQAPAPVSAMFSGFLLNTALYCILRYAALVRRALGTSFADNLLIGFGILSILVAAGFIVFQRDAKRLLAYSSVEHVGIMTLGFGLGPVGAFAALFHMLGHSLSKSLAFFAVGRLGQHYGTHDMGTLTGALRTDWVWGLGLLGSILALIGAAPFAIFMSEYQLLRAAAGTSAWVVLVIFLAAGAVVFIAALRHLIRMVYGEPGPMVQRARSGKLSFLIVAGVMGSLLFFGLCMPPFLIEAIGRAAEAAGARP